MDRLRSLLAARSVRWSGAVAALGALVVYAVGALSLLPYGFDFDPSEGQALDAARRVFDDAPLYTGRVAAPISWPYLPLFPAVLAPFQAAAGPSMTTARVVSTAIGLLALVALYLLCRRAADRPLSLAAVGALVAPVGTSFWLVLVRVDALLILLLTAAAVIALPPALAPGAGRLSWGRAGIAGLVLVLACLAKPTAAVHGAPLVLAGFLVDARSALRLSGAAIAWGAAACGLLLVVHGQAIVDATAAWALDAAEPGKARGLAALFLSGYGPLVVVVAALLVARLARAPRRLDGAWALVVGGLLGLALAGKHGASVNYLLPLAFGLAAVAAREAAARSPAASGLASSALAVCILFGLSRAPFPAPTSADAATWRFLQGFVQARGAPILSSKGEMLYVALGQPVEIEGDSFHMRSGADDAGTTALLRNVDRGAYRTVILRPVGLTAELRARVAASYVEVGECLVGYWASREPMVVHVPRGEAGRVRFEPPADAMCQPLP